MFWKLQLFISVYYLYLLLACYCLYGQDCAFGRHIVIRACNDANLRDVNFSVGTFGRICRGTVTIQRYNSLSQEPVLIKTLTGVCFVASIFICGPFLTIQYNMTVFDIALLLGPYVWIFLAYLERLSFLPGMAFLCSWNGFLSAFLEYHVKLTDQNSTAERVLLISY